MPGSGILWQNEAKTVVLLDLPRSIEEAQCLSDKQPLSQEATNVTAPSRRLISSPAPQHPFLTPEPKSSDYAQSATSPSSQIAELMTIASVESALHEIGTSYQGPWCLPRITSKPKQPNDQHGILEHEEDEHSKSSSKTTRLKRPSKPSTPSYHLPPKSHPLTGPFSPPPNHQKFNLILLDPPWPNRSAKRKRSGHGTYTPLNSLSSTSQLLCSFPISSLLSDENGGGLVAVWVTNSSKFQHLLLDPKKGIFAKNWGVELVGEWILLKVTSQGEPIVDLGSKWRKPYERLLIARKRGVAEAGTGAVKTKVIVSVPDIHSRKPNLKRLFEEEEGLLPTGYTAMEMFARNLTAGWWAWGNEVTKFQEEQYWVEEGEEVVSEVTALEELTEEGVDSAAVPRGCVQEDHTAK
ncbi:putative methyltransferase-like protein 4 [Triangularia verruculosa]|uniref:Methyltransferase-like protein 4 n=1 Tax=Triangularia verruculosa TaxID=2587418 RepID=A0AAN6XGC6_9PEZI|nr:putative methyltransferase-like protein 4 [Triangularia verruculosa]